MLSFTILSSVDPFHGVQSFRNRLLHFGSPTGSQVLQANLLQCGPLFMGHISFQEPAPVWALHGVTASLGHIHLLWHGSCTGCRWICAPPWSSMGYRGTTCFTMVFSRCCRGISALAQAAPSAPPSSLTLVSAALFLSNIVTPRSQLLLYSFFTLS